MLRESGHKPGAYPKERTAALQKTGKRMEKEFEIELIPQAITQKEYELMVEELSQIVYQLIQSTDLSTSTTTENVKEAA